MKMKLRLILKIVHTVARVLAELLSIKGGRSDADSK